MNAAADLLTEAETASYPLLALAVLIGSIVPVIPTGPVLSAASALALHTPGRSILLVLAVAVLAAMAGDLTTYAVCRYGGRGAARWIRRGETEDQLDRARRRLGTRGDHVIVVGRLVPGGRIPVLLAAGLIAYPWPRLLLADLVGCVAWAMTYALMGLLGGSLFTRPWVGALAATVGVLAVTGLVQLAVRLAGRWRERRTEP
ncbi:DedA family protein [Allostreptomyces psammosilenae]|uniref:Membrane protein DedA with SNARE-associated domain n=1 Tax=Allostreptomyces psammosilenae TaxID=1892865 RepID=A0A852ZLN8_9ACTN|nr:VTT domain-containing protein [Allostreptomyces psammosilenae]NYI03309.1 membrane protein DedA with SNARE-associated domain [Allostreptomyces psammosilenae]